MLTFQNERTGSDCSQAVIASVVRDLRLGRSVLLLVPQQQALAAESAVNAACVAAGVPMAELEVLNFSRLANRVFRQYGGLSYHYAGAGARCVLMWNTLCRLSGQLKLFGRTAAKNAGTVKLLEGACANLKRYRVTPKMLLDGADELAGDDELLGAKLHDLALIAADFDHNLKERYTDPSDDLAKLDELLKTHPFFLGKQVYLDSFYGFTPDQYAILRHIIRSADETVIALPEETENASATFASVADTVRRLKRIAADEKVPVQVLKPWDTAEPKPAMLAALQDSFCNTMRQSGTDVKCDGSVTVHAARTLYEECDAVAADIARRVRNGARYRDFLIIARDASRYDGAAQLSFETYGIPLFMAIRRSLHTLPLARFVLSALRVVTLNWRCEDVLSYMKTGLCDLSEEEADALEEYAAQWNIRGELWTRTEAWCMSPDGYQDEDSQARNEKEASRRLLLANTAREKLVRPLVVLRESLAGGVTVREGCTAIFAFLDDGRILQRMENDTDMLPVDVWNAVMDSLDVLVDAVGDTQVDAAALYQLLTLVFGCCDMGRIPTSVDSVTFGSALTVRASGAKHIYILGLNEGVFPAPPPQGLFSERDLCAMESVNIELAPKEELSMAAEQFHLYRALCAAREGLHLYYAQSDPDGSALAPSAPIERLKTLFPSLSISDCGAQDPLDRAMNPESAIEVAAQYRGTPQGEALNTVLKKAGKEKQLAALRRPLCDREGKVTSAQAKAIFGDTLNLSQSKLKMFGECPMGFYGTYVLNLRERKNDRFRPNDLGTFVHRVLEVVLREVCEADRIGQVISDDEIRLAVERVADRYYAQAFPDAAYRTPRTESLFARMKRTCRFLLRDILDEFAQSDFRPLGFEMPINGKDGEICPEPILLSNGAKGVIHGTVDRLDGCRVGDRYYVRVVDYKTGQDSVNRADLEEGENDQLLLYLDAAVEASGNSLKEKMGNPETVLPAGVMYYRAGAPLLDGDEDGTDAADEAALQKMPLRSVLLNSDADVLAAASREAERKDHFTGISFSQKTGEIDSRQAWRARTEDELYGLLRTARERIRNKAEAIESGSSDAVPRSMEDHGSCTYCRMKPVCRYFVTEGEEGEDGSYGLD